MDEQRADWVERAAQLSGRLPRRYATIETPSSHAGRETTIVGPSGAAPDATGL